MDFESVVAAKSEQLMEQALDFKASDIHIVPASSKYVVLFRKYGRLHPAYEYPQELGVRIVTYLKFLSALDISEKRKPQSGAFQKQFQQVRYAFRISTLPSIMGYESIVVRILKQDATLPLQDLVYNPSTVATIERLIQHRQGLLLFSGATGSGKSTSLYALVHYCCTKLNRHVISLEDPVEKNHEQVLQIQVNERAGVTYAEGLRAILRHSPDVIMIGEIRDRETASIAIEAALSGHLVLSTIHAKDTVNSLYRLMDLGISVDELRQSLVAVVAQTLVEMKRIDERRALFEMLSDRALFEAIEAISSGTTYALELSQTLESQLYQLESDHHVEVVK